MRKMNNGVYMIIRQKVFLLYIVLSLLFAAGLISACEVEETAVDSGGNGKGYPIILVHGFLGWGRDEVGGRLGHFYWGGYDDLQKVLEDAGYECHTGVVGPFSSNWDRACELYAQLKGTRTDYGIAHSRKHNHERYGRDFRGKALIKNEKRKPDWGSNGSHRKVHLIAHSQGGHTVRILAQLLENGFQEEKDTVYPADEPISPLFTGGEGTKDLVQSITTMASTHNGTSLANGVIKLVPIIEEILVNLIAVLGLDTNEIAFNIYDFKLQQFGLKSRLPGESFKEYWARIIPLMETFLDGSRKDTCLWDLSPEGAMEQNAWVHAQPNIYYFSFAGESSCRALTPDPLDNFEYHQVPDINNPVYFLPFGLMIGAYTCNDSRYHGLWRATDNDFFHMQVEDRVPVDSSWWTNDGIVNTISMNGPWLYPENYTGTKDLIINWDKTSTPSRGVWNFGGVFSNVDHFDITGTEILPIDRDNYNCPEFAEHAEDWYVQWAKVLASLK